MARVRARPIRTGRWAVVGLMALVVSSGACRADEEGAVAPAEQIDVADRESADPGWVGSVDGTDAFAAVVVGGGRVVAYVCDGDAGIAEWFTGETGDEGSFALTSASGATMRGQEGDDRVTGSVGLGDGATHRFVLERAEAGAGLYRVEDPEAERDGVRAGWIVDNDGDQRGSLRIAGASSPAPALPGSTLTVEDTSYTVVVYSVPTRPPPGGPGPVPIPYPISDKVS